MQGMYMPVPVAVAPHPEMYMPVPVAVAPHPEMMVMQPAVEAMVNVAGHPVPDMGGPSAAVMGHMSVPPGTAIITEVEGVAVIDDQNQPEKKRRRRKSEVASLYRCPAPECDKTFASHAGLYLHKRSKHPEIIVARQKLQDCQNPHTCPVEGCGKIFVSAGGLCLHRQSKHPDIPHQPRGRKKRTADDAGILSVDAVVHAVVPDQQSVVPELAAPEEVVPQAVVVQDGAAGHATAVPHDGAVIVHPDPPALGGGGDPSGEDPSLAREAEDAAVQAVNDAVINDAVIDDAVINDAVVDDAGVQAAP